MSRSPADLIDAWLTARLDGETARWLHEEVGGALRNGVGRRFLLAFGLAPRRVGRNDLGLDPDELAEAAAARPGWQPGRWSIDQGARALLVLALPTGDAVAHTRALDGLFADADLGELVALYQTLPLLPHPPAYRSRAAEGLRTNMKPVFEAVALANPYPAEQLDRDAWNQLVLKCLFIGSPLHRVHGVDARATRELARTLSHNAHERWAAERSVPPELRRCVGPFAEGKLRDDLERVLAAGDDRERAAVALSVRGHPHAEGLLAARAADVERATLAHPTWESVY
jgi:hypothetical protein